MLSPFKNVEIFYSFLRFFFIISINLFDSPKLVSCFTVWIIFLLFENDFEHIDFNVLFSLSVFTEGW